MSQETRTIIVTGASDGIGKAITLELAAKGHTLILLARDEKRLDQVSKEAQEKGAKSAKGFSVNLTKPSDISKFTAEITKQYISIDGLINNAGIWQKVADPDQISEEETLNVINTNLTGLILLTQKILPVIRKSDNGFIINVSSRSGYCAQSGQSVYTASKYGVRGFTEVLSEDLKETDIRVAGIYQGGTNTQMFNKAGEDFSNEKLSTFIPTEELAKVVSFLISRPKGIWLPEIRIEKH